MAILAQRVAVIGAGGAIGNALVHEYANSAGIERVLAFSRSPCVFNYDCVTSLVIDYDDDQSLADAAACCDDLGGMDLIVVATGILHEPGLLPEKSLSQVSSENLHRLFQVDTVLPVRLAQCFLNKLHREKPSIMAFLTARVGSIGDNRLGGWYAYRMAKSALNMFIKTVAIETKRKHKNQIVVGLHPGTVDSALSQPFKTHLDPAKVFSPQQSAQYLSTVMSKLSAADSGQVKAWDGAVIQP